MKKLLILASLLIFSVCVVKASTPKRPQPTFEDNQIMKRITTITEIAYAAQGKEPQIINQKGQLTKEGTQLLRDIQQVLDYLLQHVIEQKGLFIQKDGLKYEIL